MGSIHVQRFNAAKVRVEVSDDIMIQELYEFFQYKDESAGRNPFSKWDGKVRLFNKNKQLLPRGLVKHLAQFCKTAKYQFSIDDGVVAPTDVSLEEVQEYINGLNLTATKEGEIIDIEPYDYQVYGVWKAIQKDSSILLADTNAGKTLMLYILTRFYLDLFGFGNARFLILCPSVMLVNQMRDDFENYSLKDDNFNASCVHTIKAGSNKYRQSPITVSTWQSIQDEDPEFYVTFTHVFCDEVHGAAAKKITRIMDNCVNAYKRIGVTGSLKETELHTLQVQAHFGAIVRVADTQMLKERGQSAETDVRMLFMKYSKEEKKRVNNLDYMGKIEYLVNHPGRNQFIAKLVNGLQGNTLIILDRKKHSELVYEAIQAIRPGRVYRIDGDVKEAIREEIKLKMENNEGVTLVASYGTLSTGVSIRRLHNLILGHPAESIIRILQTVGRMLRTHSTKEKANILDLVDDFSLNRNSKFTFIEHAKSRHGYYTQKQHPVKNKLVDATHFEPVAQDIYTQIKFESDRRKDWAEKRKLMRENE